MLGEGVGLSSTGLSDGSCVDDIEGIGGGLVVGRWLSGIRVSTFIGGDVVLVGRLGELVITMSVGALSEFVGRRDDRIGESVIRSGMGIDCCSSMLGEAVSNTVPMGACVFPGKSAVGITISVNGISKPCCTGAELGTIFTSWRDGTNFGSNKPVGTSTLDDTIEGVAVRKPRLGISSFRISVTSDGDGDGTFVVESVVMLKAFELPYGKKVVSFIGRDFDGLVDNCGGSFISLLNSSSAKVGPATLTPLGTSKDIGGFAGTDALL